MSNDLAIPPGKKIALPKRDPDMYSKRGIPYWFGPEWVRSQNGNIGRIKAIKTANGVDLHMLSRDGNLTYIKGSIQDEFHAWHQDNEIDCILLGVDEDSILVTDWEYE